jgi:hypothetical protein
MIALVLIGKTAAEERGLEIRAFPEKAESGIPMRARI